VIWLSRGAFTLALDGRLSAPTSIQRPVLKSQIFLHQPHILTESSLRGVAGCNNSTGGRYSSFSTRLSNCMAACGRGKTIISIERRQSGESHWKGITSCLCSNRTFSTASRYRYSVCLSVIKCHSGLFKTVSGVKCGASFSAAKSHHAWLAKVMTSSESIW